MRPQQHLERDETEPTQRQREVSVGGSSGQPCWRDAEQSFSELAWEESGGQETESAVPSTWPRGRSSCDRWRLPLQRLNFIEAGQ